MKTGGFLDEQMKKRIILALEGSGVHKVILFGSHATGRAVKDSDIDLLVVTDEGYIPQSFSEKMKIKVRIAKALSFIREAYPLDLIVHTRPMYQQFINLKSAFNREIDTNGIILYEKND
ncbi:MAG: nucleotidyltransferase domain-containing protein [Bacteroidales bacterium]|nr:nucleotidyltransferase domain-containing protein [Bacteroidales bacterium]